MLFFSPSCCLWVFNCGILLLTLKLPQLGWSEVYCCYEGNVFTLERCFIWLALKGFFQQQFHFQKCSWLHRVGKQGNQRNTFSDSMLYFLLIRMTLKFRSLETTRRTYFCFSDQEKNAILCLMCGIHLEQFQRGEGCSGQRTDQDPARQAALGAWCSTERLSLPQLFCVSIVCVC